MLRVMHSCCYLGYRIQSSCSSSQNQDGLNCSKRYTCSVSVSETPSMIPSLTLAMATRIVFSVVDQLITKVSGKAPEMIRRSPRILLPCSSCADKEEGNSVVD